MDYSGLEKMLFPEFTGWLLWAKIFFILFDLGVIAFILYVWITTIYIRRLFIWDLWEFFTFRPFFVRRIENDWIKIKKRLLTKNEAEFKLAVIEADLLVDDVLKRLNFEGKDLGEKLEKNPHKFTNPDGMKAANRIYQDLVYDPGYSLDYDNAKNIILTFEQGLKDVSAFVEK
jgi:hypothetical protein